MSVSVGEMRSPFSKFVKRNFKKQANEKNNKFRNQSNKICRIVLD